MSIMDWKYTEKNEKPLAYATGNWDGKNSDQVIAEDKAGKRYLAHFCEGTMDGSEYEDWYDSHDYFINEPIVRWLAIPI